MGRSASPSRAVGDAPSRPPIRVLVDTNVLLDVILARTPWDAEAVALMNAASTGIVEGYVASHALPTVFYLVEREKDTATARGAVSDILDILDVVAVDEADLRRALTLEVADFEDAVHAVAGLNAGVKYIVTRNPKDFRGAGVDTRTAGEIVALVGT